MYRPCHVVLTFWIPLAVILSQIPVVASSPSDVAGAPLPVRSVNPPLVA